MSETPPALPADERRRATATTGGFVFQWWLTVYAWLELGDAEALYVESSEDFEVVTAATGKTVQVKAGTSRSLTLRSDEVVESLNHYWAMAAQDQRAVRFVLLAQAEAGVEQDAPFGAGIPGIREWQDAGAGKPELAARLRNFLRDDAQIAPKLAPALHDFLRTASVDEFSDRLLKRVILDLGREPTGMVQQLVRDRLIVLAAERHGASVAEAERVADVLFSQVVHLAANKERVALTRPQLLRILEESTVGYRERVGLAMRPVAAGSLCEAGSTALWEAPMDELRLPTLPAQILQRPELVAALRSQVEAKSMLVLYGSTGMGKTTLAKLVAGSAAGSWWWLDLQGCPPLAAQLAFRRVLAVADHHRREPINLVLDGYMPEGLPAAALNTLRAVALLLRHRGGRVIITMQRPLTTTEAAGLGWADFSAVTAPRMDSAEIARFMRELGCADAQRAGLWATTVHLHTEGHPQLVHATCLWLQQRAWPQFDGQTFRDSATPVETERAQARRLVARLSGEELELLTRLGVLGSTFRRDHALGLAEKLERLPGAGFHFDVLLGPWIEPGSATGYHRLSPLLADNLSTLAPARRRELETASALTRLETAPIYVHDAARALQHTFSAQNAPLAGQIAAKFLLTPREQRAESYRFLLWLTWVDNAEIDALFSSHTALASLIHLLRFQIVAELLPAQVGPYIATAEKSLAGLKPELAIPQRFAFLIETLMHCSRAMPTRDTVRYLEEVTELAVKLAEKGEVYQWFPRALLPPALRTVSAYEHVRISLAGVVLGRAEGRDFIVELMKILDGLPEERRQPLLRAFTAWPTLLMLAWDQVWLSESAKSPPDWPTLLDSFAAAVTTATRWKSNEFIVVAARAASVVCNEYLDDPDRASRLLDGIEATRPAYAAVLLDQRAKIAAQQERLPDAVVAMQQALPQWDDSDYGAHGKMLACQRAGAWAGKAQLWQKSGEFFRQGAQLARKSHQLVAEAGLETDAGVALWYAAEKPAALNAFARAIELCAEMGPATGDLATFQFQKLLGHILLSLAMTYRRSASSPPQAPIIAGMASEPTLNEKVKALPPPRLAACKVFVAMIEHNHQLGDACWRRYGQEVLNAQSVSTRNFALELAIRKAIRQAACGDFPALAAQQASVLAVARVIAAQSDVAEQFREGDDADFPPVSWPFDDQICGEPLFLAGLISAAAQRGDLVGALRDLEAHAGESPFPEALRQWVGRVQTITAASEADLLSITRSATVNSDRIAAAMALLGQPRLAPDILWGALYVILTSLNGMFWGADVTKALDELAGHRWRTAAENRFAFRNPTLWLPELKAQCGEPVNGMQRLAVLLLAALPALDLKIDQGIIKQLQQMREGTLDMGWQKLAPRLA